MALFPLSMVDVTSQWPGITCEILPSFLQSCEGWVRGQVGTKILNTNTLSDIGMRQRYNIFSAVLF